MCARRNTSDGGTSANALTEDYVEVGYWSTIEVPVGIICACLPAVRSLFSKVFPRVFGTTRQEKSAYDYESRGNSSKLSKLSTKPKLVSNNTGSNHTQIRIKQEWTVLSNPLDANRSDVELVPFDKAEGSHAEPSIQRTTDFGHHHDDWRGHDFPIRDRV
jgi:hypothetical protein